MQERLRCMVLKRAAVLLALTSTIFASLITPMDVRAVSAGIMGGGSIYNAGTSGMNALRASGFNTVILWTIHVYYPSGDLIFNSFPICTGGVYVASSNFPAQLATLKQAPTSVNRLEFAVGSGGVNDFSAVQQLIAAQGTGTNSILYRNFNALIEATGVDAICFNDETLYDVSTMVTFGRMLTNFNVKITLCPYNNATVWQNVKSQLGNAVDAVYLQCYAGGAGNNPTTWNTYFGGLKVSPGLWCKHGTGCSSGDSAATVTTKMNTWKNSPGIPGGWMWLHDDMMKCTANSMADYATAITGVTVQEPVTSATWDGGGGNNAWTNSTNWVDNLAPDPGATLHFAGSTRLTPSNNFAAGTNFSSIYFDAGAGAFNLMGNAVTLNNRIHNSSTNAQNISLPIVLSTGSTVWIYTMLNSGNLTISGVISGEGNLLKSQQAASTTLILSGSNTYSGGTTINAGNLSISSIKNLGSGLPSSLGMPAVGNGTIGMGTAARLIYTGAGDTSDRPFELQGSPLRITQSGSWHLLLSGDLTVNVSGVKALTLDGSSAGTAELSGAIMNPPDSGNTRIVKDGTGTWTLSGTNSYAGNTTILAGVLSLGSSGSIAGSPIIAVSSGAVFDVSGLPESFVLGNSQTLSGAGVITGNVTIAGTIDPGAGSTSATLAVQGDLLFAPGSTYGMDVNAITNDVVMVSGDVNVGGASLVIRGNLTNDSYLVLSSGGTLSGMFDGLTNGAPVPTTGYSIEYGTDGASNGVVLHKIESPIQYVIHISVDGMHADAPRVLINSGLGPNFQRLYDEGASTDHARTDVDSTVTSPNHATMLTGRPVNHWPGKPGHLWGNNDTHPWDRWALTLHMPHYVGTNYGPGPGEVFVFTNAQYYADSGPNRTNYEYISSAFDVVKDSGKRTSHVYSKSRLLVEEHSYGPIHGRLAPNLGVNDPGVNKLDHAQYISTFLVVSNWMPEMVANPFHYSFLHFSLMDDRGHSYTWSFTNRWRSDLGEFESNWNTNQNRYFPASYMGAIQQIDVYLGEIFSLIETNAELHGKTAIVITTDHGGKLGDFDHGFITDPDCFRINVFAWGPGIPAGGDLYSLNPQYSKPGSEDRPDYNHPEQPIRNGDTPNLAMSLLGLGPVPGSSINVDQTLGAVDSDGDGLSDNYEPLIVTDPYRPDTDGDGMSDGDEHAAGTIPTDSASVFGITSLEPSLSVDGQVVQWSSVTNRKYSLWGSSNLLTGFSLITNNVLATPLTNSYTNIVEGAEQLHYRIGVQP